MAPREYDAYRIGGIAHQTQDVLARVVLFDTPERAADCVHVVGFTARGRSAKRNVQRPREAAGEIVTLWDPGPVALLFGREDKRLSNEALDRCHRVVTIPSDPAYPRSIWRMPRADAVRAGAGPRGEAPLAFKPPRRQAPSRRRATQSNGCSPISSRR